MNLTTQLIQDVYANVAAAGEDDEEGVSWVCLHAWFHYVPWILEFGVLDLGNTA